MVPGDPSSSNIPESGILTVLAVLQSSPIVEPFFCAAIAFSSFVSYISLAGSKNQFKTLLYCSWGVVGVVSVSPIHSHSTMPEV